MTDTTVSETIQQQLGHRFFAMTGAYPLAHGDNWLSIRIGRNRAGVNRVKITLNGRDLYDVNYVRVRGLKTSDLGINEDVYGDMLAQTIGAYCGLAISL